MAASTIEQIMLGIEARLQTISGLRVTEYVPDNPTVPAAIVGVPDIDNYHATMGKARFTLNPTVTVLVSKALDRAGQLKLAGYANPTGPMSVVAAIEGGKTLGGVVDDCVVLSFRVLGEEEAGAIGYYGGEFQLSVIARGV